MGKRKTKAKVKKYRPLDGDDCLMTGMWIIIVVCVVIIVGLSSFALWRMT